MCNIQVALSSTTHVVSNTFDPGIEKADIPVLHAIMGMALYGGGEQMEHSMALLCKQMAKEVFVETEQKRVFVGMDHSNPDTGLIDYTEEKNSKFAQSFFKRWEETRILYMVFQVISQKETIFSLVGLYSNGKWEHLDYKPRSNISIIQYSKP